MLQVLAIQKCLAVGKEMGLGWEQTLRRRKDHLNFRAENPGLGEDYSNFADVFALGDCLAENLFVSICWNNGVMDASFVYMFSGGLASSGYRVGFPVYPGQQGLFWVCSWREPSG